MSRKEVQSWLQGCAASSYAAGAAAQKKDAVPTGPAQLKGAQIDACNLGIDAVIARTKQSQ